MIVPAFHQALRIIHHPVELSQHRDQGKSVAGSLRLFFPEKMLDPNEVVIRWLSWQV
jgi:hypothetical protein